MTRMVFYRRLIDLSLTIDTTVSEPAPLSIEYISHQQGAEILGKPLKLRREDWPDEMAISTESVSLTTHTGTHVDAPVHYGPYCGGRQSKTIEELPLEWFCQDGVMIDCEGDARCGPVRAAELRLGCQKLSYRIKPFDIVLIRTGADALWRKPE